MLMLGHDRKSQEPVTLDVTHSRVLLICGKRGSGKSYTLGVLAEELFQQSPRQVILLVDPMGIFWTMAQATTATSVGLPMQLIVPGDPATRYTPAIRERLQSLGLTLQRLTLNPAELSPDAWCGLFELSINEPLGIALYRSVQALNASTPSYALRDLTDTIQRDGLSQDRTKEALVNRVSMAAHWELFDAAARPISELLSADALNVLDCSVLDYSTHGLRSLVLAIVARQLFTAWHATRRHAELGDTPSTSKLWLLIDEAHQFIPQGGATLTKDMLIRWVKEGRQPGLSCVLASQQPGSLEMEVLSQCDAVIAHKLTNVEDITSVNRLSQAYMGSELKVYLRHLTGPGQAVLVDDARERVTMLQVRERLTRHGGGEL